jgi:DNA-binding MarR family transcriptional regulator/GNAT superfamily N-acetyltransferase
MDLIMELGALAFSSRLKRLSDRLAQDVKRLYHRLDVEFEPRWFTLLYALNSHKSVSISKLAKMIGLTHTSVHQLALEMSREGLVSSSGTQADRRKRLLSITPKGRRLVTRLEPIWKEIEKATQRLIDECDSDLFKGLDSIEESLEQENMFRRIWFQLPERPEIPIQIEPYRPAYKKYFESLNNEWLLSYDMLEPYDEKVLGDPRRYVLKRGGQILFALVDGDVVGTCALLQIKGHWELAKLAVTESMRGLGVGKKLLEEAVIWVCQAGAEALYLQTSVLLKEANRLYERQGFIQIEALPYASPQYNRDTLFMKLNCSESKT